MQNKIIHAIAAFLLFAIPVVLSSHAGILQVTVGGLLNAIYLTASQLLQPTAPTNSII